MSDRLDIARPPEPQIHPSSSCPPNQCRRETEAATGQKVQEGVEVVGEEEEEEERQGEICDVM